MKINIAQHEFPYIWNGVYYFVLSDYPNISPWELKKLIAFMEYEKRNGRGETEIICEDAGITEAVKNAVARPETVENALLPAKITECTACKHNGCLTEFVCHTAAIENAKKILSSGKLLSAVRAFGKTADELVLDRRNAAVDPADYFDYVMFAWGNCQAGDRLVMERLLDRLPGDDDVGKDFAPGVRFYFRYDDIIRHPQYVFDGHHPVKIKDELVLSDYLYACIVPEHHRNDFTNFILPEIAERVYYLAQDGLGIWDWSKKVYEFVEGMCK
jgi:hypothetical protein